MSELINKELYYSNGFDIFGPVSMEEFSRYRYYKSTLIWYEGLRGWIYIGDCDELNHLIGVSEIPEICTSSDFPEEKKKKQIKRTGFRIKSLRWLVPTGLACLAIGWLIVSEKGNNLNGPNGNNNENRFNNHAMINEPETEASIKKEAELNTYREHWEKFITVEANKYRTGLFGGIRDLKLTLNNLSPCVVESVEIKIDYLKRNGDIHHSESLAVKNLQPGMNREIIPEGSNRGVDIRYSITAIKSEAMNLAINKLNDINAYAEKAKSKNLIANR